MVPAGTYRERTTRSSRRSRCLGRERLRRGRRRVANRRRRREKRRNGAYMELPRTGALAVLADERVAEWRGQAYRVARGLRGTGRWGRLPVGDDGDKAAATIDRYLVIL